MRERPAGFFRAADDTRALGFDIALVNMGTPVAFNRFTRPAERYRGRIPFNIPLAAAGFGATCNNPRVNCLARSLMVGEMQITSIGTNGCGFNVINRPPADSLLCAINIRGVTCGGDSGGYLGGTINGVHFVVGVTNFGDCGTVTAFASVSHYLDWMLSIGG